MNLLKTTFYDEFACIGAECPLTCCGGWKIDLSVQFMGISGKIKENDSGRDAQRKVCLARFYLGWNMEHLCGKIDAIRSLLD